MTDPAALTDEELARLEGEDPHDSTRSRKKLRQLAAALRASRADLSVVTADRDSWKRLYAIAKERADKAESEVKRLNRLVAFYAGSDDPLRGP